MMKNFLLNNFNNILVGVIIFIILLFILSYSNNRYNEQLTKKIEFLLSSQNNIDDPLSQLLHKIELNLQNVQSHYANKDNYINDNFFKLLNSQREIQSNIFKISKIFENNHARGKWGEIQLERIAELSGMLPFCDFNTQNRDFDGIRPDMIIQLPNEGKIFVDSKAPLESYYKLAECESDATKNFKREHCKAMKNHIYGLSKKEYWKYDNSPDFTVMFIPIESIWIAALDEDQSLMEYAIKRNIIVATPMTLISLMKTIFIGWKHVKFAQDSVKLKKTLDSINKYMEIFRSLIKTSEKNLEENINSLSKIKENIGTIEKQINSYKFPNKSNKIVLEKIEPEPQTEDKTIEKDSPESPSTLEQLIDQSPKEQHLQNQKINNSIDVLNKIIRKKENNKLNQTKEKHQQ